MSVTESFVVFLLSSVIYNFSMSISVQGVFDIAVFICSGIFGSQLFLSVVAQKQQMRTLLVIAIVLAIGQLASAQLGPGDHTLYIEGRPEVWKTHCVTLKTVLCRGDALFMCTALRSTPLCPTMLPLFSLGTVMRFSLLCFLCLLIFHRFYRAVRAFQLHTLEHCL